MKWSELQFPLCNGLYQEIRRHCILQAAVLFPKLVLRNILLMITELKEGLKIKQKGERIY